MSLRSIVEIMLYLDRFMNIELLNQGLYQVRVQVRSEAGEVARPYDFSRVSKKEDCILSGHILEEHSYVSETFMVRFNQEKILLQEIVQLRLELPAYPLADTSLLLCCDLMFADLDSPNNQFEFQSINSFSARVSSILTPQLQYVPVYFDDFHFAQLDMVFHLFLTDFRFQMSPMEPKKNSKASPVKSFQELVCQLTDNFHPGKLDLLYNQYAKHLRHIYGQQNSLYRKSLAGYESTASLSQGGNISDFRALLKLKEEHPPLLKERLSESYRLSEPEEQSKATVCFQKDLNALCQLSFQTVHHFVSLVKSLGSDYMPPLCASHLQLQSDLLHQHIFSHHESSVSPFNMSSKEMSKKVRRQLLHLNDLGIDDLRHFQESKQAPNPLYRMPILFETVSGVAQKVERVPAQVSVCDQPGLFAPRLVVLVHGFQGNNLDMKIVKNHLQALYPRNYYLMSQANEFMTEQDIAQSGLQLAQEIGLFLDEHGLTPSLERLSFIGHSLGGVIIRAALPHLTHLAPMFFFYLSLATPHLGYSLSSSKLVDLGMWYMKKQKQNISLNQLAMTDDTSPKACFLHGLSQNRSLDHFKHLIFIASQQDTYVPFDSALVRPVSKPASSKARLHNQMVQQTLEGSKCQSTHRLEVNFSLPTLNLDKFIGRAAHIQFIENNQFLRMVTNYYGHLFA